MGSKKLTACWHILRSGSFFLTTATDKDRLTEHLKLAVETKNAYDEMLNTLEQIATDEGELHRLQALRAVIDMNTNEKQ